MEAFLKNFSKNTAKKQTHLSFIGGKYNIESDQLENFHKVYFKTLKENRENMYLIEKVSKKLNYYQDIDIPVNVNDVLEPVKERDPVDTTNDNLVLDIIKTTQFVMNSNLEIKGDLTPIIAKRNNWRYHIHYPNVALLQKDAIQLTKTVKDVMGKRGDCLDTTVYKTGLRMIGSKKDDSETVSYKIYDLETKKYTEFNDELFTYELFKKTSIVNSDDDTEPSDISTTVSRELTPIEKEIEKLLETNKLNLDFAVSASTTKHTINKAGVPSIFVTPKDKQICPFKGRYHSRKSNPVYIELSQRGMSVRCFDEDCVTKRFPEFGIEIEFDNYPLLREALKTNKLKDLEISDEVNYLLMNSLSGTHYNIAKVLYSIYKDRFMVDDVRNSDWYEFNKIRGKWKRSYAMNVVVSEEFSNYYRSLKTESGNGAGGTGGAVTEQTSVPFNEHIDRLVNKLENVTFKTSVINEAKYLFYQSDPQFVEHLDSNPYLIGFENGVYDLKAGEFRAGRREDYITFTTGYNWVPYNGESKEVRAIYKFLSEILTNNTVREYTLGVLGRSLIGFPDEKFYIWTGLSGANGKSTLVNFLEMTLGDYAISQDVALLTNKRAASNAATPEIIEIKGKRMVFFQEPEPTDRLRTGILKQFTGGDTIRARELYKKPICFRSMSNFFMCCNDLPHVSALDGGTWRRIRVTEFTSRFCDDPKKKNEFRIDPDLKWKLEDWKPYFMSILIHYYHKYAGKKLVEPPEVTAATARYKTDNDKYNDFFEECLDTVGDTGAAGDTSDIGAAGDTSDIGATGDTSDTGTVGDTSDTGVVQSHGTFTTTLDLFSAFEFWWKTNYLNEKMPSKSEFKIALRGKYGEEITKIDKTTNKKYKGFAVFIRDTELDEGVFTARSELD
jgi:P4 family phage/plasmid primase-like protien